MRARASDRSAALLHPAERPRRAAASTRPRYWPALLVIPLLLTGQFKAVGVAVIGGVDTTLLSAALVVAVAAGYMILGARTRMRPLWPYFVFVLVCTLSFFWSPGGPYATYKLQELGLTTACVVSFAVLLRSDSDVLGYWRSWVITGVVVAVASLWLPRADSLDGRLGLGDGTLGVAYLAGAAILVIVVELIDGSGSWWFMIPAGAVCGVVLLSVGSRGPVVSLAAALVYVLLSARFGWKGVAALVFVATAGVVGYLQAPEVSQSRLTMLTDLRRQFVRDEAWQFFVQHPLLGTGWGSFPVLSITGYEYPHNLFAEVAAEMGLLGLLALGLVLAVVALNAWRCRHAPGGRAAGAIALFFLVGQQFSFDVTNRLMWLAIVPLLLLPRMLEREAVATEAAAATAPAPRPGPTADPAPAR